MGKKLMLKKIFSAIIGILALVVFAGETSAQYFWLQLVAGAVLVGVIAWNGAFKEAL